MQNLRSGALCVAVVLGSFTTACGGASSVGDLIGPVSDGGDAASSPGNGGSGKGDIGHLPCGNTTCAIPAQACCVTQRNGNAFAYACVDGTACPMSASGKGVLSLQCSGAANCSADTVCCVSTNNNSAVSVCRTSCGGNEAQLCDKAAASTGCKDRACSSNNISDWGLPSTYATCGGIGN